MSGILTFLNFLNKHLYTIGITDNPICPKCGDEKTAEHFPCKCPGYISARGKTLIMLPYNNIWSISSKNILDYLSVDTLFSLIRVITVKKWTKRLHWP